jgi:hypothetical protein
MSDLNLDSQPSFGFSAISETAAQPSSLDSVNLRPTQLAIFPGKITQYLGGIIVLLLLLSIGSQIVKYVFGYPRLMGFIRLFFVGEENNIPTTFSTFNLLFTSTLLSAIGFVKEKANKAYSLHWLGLSLIFLFLSIDENASIHEMTIEVMQNSLKASGGLHFLWVLPSLLPFVWFVLIYLKFARTLPAKTLNLVVLAFVIYVSGVLGVDKVGEWHVEQHGAENLTYALISTLEEGLEMLGILILNHALLVYLRRYIQRIELVFK